MNDPQRVRALIRSKVAYEVNSGCWLWEGPITGNGYGRVSFDASSMPAHRAAWAAEHGPIPAGAVIMHRCDTPLCVNPEHLRAGTHAENMADCAQKKRIVSPILRSKRPRGTHCRKGHPYLWANTPCAECRKMRNKKIAQRRKEARSTPKSAAPMTADAQRAAIKEMIQRRTAEALRTPETARAALIKEGVYTQKGDLTPAYGGIPTSDQTEAPADHQGEGA